MGKTRYWMAMFILLLTLVAVIIFWLLGGQNAVLTITAVVGLILTILRWFFPISPDQYGSSNLNLPGDDDSSSSGDFRGDTFTKH